MYLLEVLDEQKLEEVRTNWVGQIDALTDTDQSDALSQGYEPVFAWFERLIQADEDNQPRALVSDDGVCSAILEIGDARRAREPSLKILNIYPAPRLAAIIEFQSGHVGSEELGEITNVLNYALTTSAALAFESGKATKLKIYGRTEEMRAFFSTIISVLGQQEEFSQSYKAYRQGQWLIFEKR